MGARFYWPQLARFIQQDPIGDDINWYTYAANNPLVYIDPEGLQGIRDVDWGEAFDWDDWWLHQRTFYGCMGNETGISDIGRGIRWGLRKVGILAGPSTAGSGRAAARKIAIDAGPSAAKYGMNLGAKRAHAISGRTRQIQVDYANLRRARGELGFAGNRVTKGWSGTATKWFRRAGRLRAAGKLIGKAGFWYTVADTTRAYRKCFDRF